MPQRLREIVSAELGDKGTLHDTSNWSIEYDAAWTEHMIIASGSVVKPVGHPQSAGIELWVDGELVGSSRILAKNDNHIVLPTIMAEIDKGGRLKLEIRCLDPLGNPAENDHHTQIGGNMWWNIYQRRG